MAPSIELLEARIAPAAVFVNANTATYTDADGDLVTVKFGKPILTAGNVGTILTTAGPESGGVLSLIDLTGVTGAMGTSISVTAKASDSGDGLANVGRIFSPEDLGDVTIRGDLNEIDAGGTLTTTPGLKSLTVQSFGVAAFIAGTGQGASVITGSLGKLVVKNDFIGPNLLVRGAAPDGSDATLGSITIGGTLSGSGANDTGYIEAQGKIGSVKIGGSIFGNVGSGSGKVVSSNGSIGKVTIGGSIYGGGTTSGGISASGGLGSVKIGGSVVGGSGEGSGIIFGGTTGIGSVTIGGSLAGGAGASSGQVLSVGNIGLAKIGGDLRGGGTSGTTTDSGLIFALNGSIARIVIGGDAVAAFGTFSGSILAREQIGSVKIGGSIYSAGTADFIIRAEGTATKPLAIAAVTVGGGVKDALFLAGYGFNNVAANGNASIGSVKVGGDWIASSIAAGVDNGVFPKFGNGLDAVIGMPTFVSKIASISIGGRVSGTVGGTDHYGFVARQIGKLSIAGTTLTIPAPGFLGRPLGLTGDFTAEQVSYIG